MRPGPGTADNRNDVIKATHLRALLEVRACALASAVLIFDKLIRYADVDRVLDSLEMKGIGRYDAR